MRTQIFALLISGFVGLAVTQVGYAAETDSENTAVEKSVPSVTIATAVSAEVQAQVPVTGSLVARQDVQIYPLVSGHEIVEILAESGDMVKQGQVLARLSTDTLEAQLAQAEAEYLGAEAAQKQAETVLERARQLRSSNNASQATLDDAVAAQANAQAMLAQAAAARRIARLNLERAEIKAPVSGQVIDRNAMIGALSGGATEPLFTMIAEGKIEMSAEVIETALQQVSVGNPVKVNVAGLGEVAGEVRLVPASVDPVTRLGIMRISLDDVAGLRTGVFASAAVITAKREAITVPAAAVLADSDGERVQVVKDGVIETRPVRAGLLWDGRREIIEGVQAGETVMARAGAFFRDGDKVRAITPEQAEAEAAKEQAADEATEVTPEEEAQ